MNKINTQAFLPYKCQHDHLHLDISTHDEAASVKAVTSASACLSRFLSADVISSYNSSTRYIRYKKHCWNHLLCRQTSRLLVGTFSPLSCCSDNLNSGSCS